MMPFSVSFWRGESLVFRVDVEADDEISAVEQAAWGFRAASRGYAHLDPDGAINYAGAFDQMTIAPWRAPGDEG
jgi:hypothetical protein